MAEDLATRGKQGHSPYRQVKRTNTQNDIFCPFVYIDIWSRFVNMSPMNISETMKNRESNILEAATRVFTRYGVKRTTMNDIAEEAGIVRQTLYNVFKNKDEVLCATIRWFCDTSLAAAEFEIAKTDKLEDQLDILFHNFVVTAYDMIEQSPDADDVINGFNALGKEELERAKARFCNAFENLLTPHAAALDANGYEVATMADYVTTAAKGVKSQARNKAHLLASLDTLKKTVLQATSG